MRNALALSAMLLVCVVGSNPLAAAPQCTLLKVVGSGLKAVNKSISPPSTIVTGNNWNSDFEVPSGAKFTRYVAQVNTPQNGQYDLKMILKYSDGSSKTVFEQPARPLGVKDTFRMTGKPKSKKDQPYQVNVLVGGTAVVGKTATVKVSGCR